MNNHMDKDEAVATLTATRSQPVAQTFKEHVAYYCPCDIPTYHDRSGSVHFVSFLFFPSSVWVNSSSLFTISPLPQTAGEWAQVLQLQRQFHQAQLSKWQQILQSSVTLLDQVGVSLNDAFTDPFHTCLLRHWIIMCVHLPHSLHIRWSSL